MKIPKSVRITPMKNVPTAIGIMNFMFICLSMYGVGEGVGDDVGELVGCTTRTKGAVVLEAATEDSEDVVGIEDLIDPSLLLLGKCFTFLALMGVARWERAMSSELEVKKSVEAEDPKDFILKKKRRKMNHPDETRV
jgi:hypothetical protein